MKVRRSEMTNKLQSAFLKEPVSAITHGLGVLLSIGALISLLVLARGHVWQTTTFALYGSTLIILYTASTLYHSLKVGPRAAYALMRFDHCAIFLLIAGTYTPVCLVAIRGSAGIKIAITEWIFALLGISMTLIWKKAPDWLRISIYIIMGWMIVLAFPALKMALPPTGIAWLVAGGLLYTCGTVVLATDRPHLWPGRFTAHDLWHMFVIGGSVCHFILMAMFITRIPV
jgi:hemolysin III